MTLCHVSFYSVDIVEPSLSSLNDTCTGTFSGYLPFRGSSMPEIVKATLAGEPSFDDVQWSATTGVRNIDRHQGRVDVKNIF